MLRRIAFPYLFVWQIHSSRLNNRLPQTGRITSSFSYCIELVFTEIFAAYFLKPSGRAGEYSTVRLGSGDGPMFSSVWRKRKSVFVTIDRPSIPKPATSSVAQTGSPENNWLYDGMRANLTIRNFITIWSINSCASSRLMYLLASRD